MPALVSIGVACAVFGVAFQQEMVAAVRVWVDSTAYNHCFLVLPLVIVLLWGRRETILRLRPRPSPWVLALVPLLSGIWMLAALAGVLEVEQLSVVALFELLLAAILGWRVFQALLAPLLFLFFLVPFGAFLVPLLQRFTTIFAVQGLELLGIPVFADGFLIQIPEGVFEVAEACAGLRFLIASVVFGCFFSVIMYRGPIRRAVFIGLSIVVPIVANGVRAFGLILVGHFEGSATAVATDHILYGWLFFTLVTFLLIAIGMTFSEPRQFPSNRIEPTGFSAPPLLASVTVLGGLALALLGPVYLMVVEQAHTQPLVPGLLAGSSHPGWVKEQDLGTDWRLPAHGAERISLATYRDDRSSVTQFIALYPLPVRGTGFTKGGDVADPKVWRVTEIGRRTVLSAGMTINVNTALIARQGHQRLVWWFYLLDDRITDSAFIAKLLQIFAAFQSGTHVGAVIAVSADASDTAQADAALNRFIATLGHWDTVHAMH